MSLIGVGILVKKTEKMGVFYNSRKEIINNKQIIYSLKI